MGYGGFHVGGRVREGKASRGLANHFSTAQGSKKAALAHSTFDRDRHAIEARHIVCTCAHTYEDTYVKRKREQRSLQVKLKIISLTHLLSGLVPLVVSLRNEI